MRYRSIAMTCVYLVQRRLYSLTVVRIRVCTRWTGRGRNPWALTGMSRSSPPPPASPGSPWHEANGAAWSRLSSSPASGLSHSCRWIAAWARAVRVESSAALLGRGCAAPPEGGGLL